MVVQTVASPTADVQFTVKQANDRPQGATTVAGQTDNEYY